MKEQLHFIGAKAEKFADERAIVATKQILKVKEKKSSLRLKGEKLKGERRIVCKGWRVQDGWGKCPVVLSGRAVGKQFFASLVIGCGRDPHRYRTCKLRWYKVVIVGLLIVKLYPFNSFSKISLLLMVCLYRSSGCDRL